MCPFRGSSAESVVAETAVAAVLVDGFIAVSAAACATPVGAFDPLLEIAEVCRRHEVWLHVDAAWAGPYAALEEKRSLFAGWEHADSLVLNPHKSLMAPIDCSAPSSRSRTGSRVSAVLSKGSSKRAPARRTRSEAHGNGTGPPQGKES